MTPWRSDRKAPEFAPPHRGGSRAREYRPASSACGSRGSFGRSEGEHRASRLETEECLTHGLEMGLAALILLHDGVDVTEPSLERFAVEDRGRAGRVISGVDDFPRLMNGPGRGEPNRRVVVHRQPGHAVDLAPDLVQRAQQECTSGAQPGL